MWIMNVCRGMFLCVSRCKGGVWESWLLGEEVGDLEEFSRHGGGFGDGRPG